ncbi:glycosyltransferase [Aquabacter sp. L1I39]|uniref:glycosyltransferase family 2 protein n=1 Tax=Aquabacter sp. L1I39 TaxID=2820278 RepID=UPI001AD9C5A6|nr:glycosyltransferase [Aquabacter sp. L1I39]QTL04175.1 glycosyltransferase [Aquabacter sp. L1I39]
MTIKEEAGLIGAVDRIESGRNVSLVMGWCIASRSRTPPAEVVVRVGDTEIGRTAHFSPRADLTAVGLEGVACGFVVTVSAALDTRTVARMALSDGHGRPVELLPRTLEIHPLAARGRIDRAGPQGISGWLFDPDAPEPLARLSFAGLEVVIPADLPRPDLAASGMRPDLQLGFELTSEDLAPAFEELGGIPGKVPVILSAGDMELDTALFGSGRPLGAIDKADAHGLTGWAVREGLPGENAAVAISIDGIPFAHLPADRERMDLRLAGLSDTGGGFALHWGRPPVRGGRFTVSVRDGEAGTELRGSPVDIQAPALPDPELRNPGLDRHLATIIVPVFNAPAALDRCLTALLRHTTARARLAVLDDASTDPAVLTVLQRLEGLGNVIVRRNRQNEGFARTVDAGIKAVQGDVVILNADTEVGPRWLENLLTASWQGPRIGTVTALSNRAGAFSAPDINGTNTLPAHLSAADVSRLVNQWALGLYPAVGTGNGFCMFIRRACYDAVGGFDLKAFAKGYGEENDFCVRAMHLGWQHVIDDRTYVLHEREASFGARAAALKQEARETLKRHSEYDVIADSFTRRTDLNTVRYQVRRAFQEAPAKVRPRMLFVISTLSGGTPQTNRDLMENLRDRYEPYLLYCNGHVLELWSADGDEQRLLESKVLDRRIDPVLHTSDAYDNAVRGWLVKYAIELVHIRHLAYHSLGLPGVCASLALPTVYSFHDYYTLCPSVKLIDETGQFCGGRCTHTPGPCRSELWDQSEMPDIKNAYVERWRARFQAAIATCDALVTTAPSVAALIGGIMPAVAGRLKVIPHGRTFARFGTAASVQPDGPFRILVAGDLSRAKGSALVSELARLLQPEGVEVHHLGGYDDGLDTRAVIAHGPYDREDFVARAEAIGAHMGLLAPLWAETYCHVLTELWAAGLPVLGRDLGAVGERIGAHGAGWLFDAADAGLLAEAVRYIRDMPEEMSQRRAEVLQWQQTEGTDRTAQAMADDYAGLYEGILASRRVLQRRAPLRPAVPPGAPQTPRPQPPGASRGPGQGPVQRQGPQGPGQGPRPQPPRPPQPQLRPEPAPAEPPPPPRPARAFR